MRTQATLPGPHPSVCVLIQHAYQMSGTILTTLALRLLTYTRLSTELIPMSAGSTGMGRVATLPSVCPSNTDNVTVSG